MSAPPPVSLGKPSLRHRLESYYSLISPDAIADKEKWKTNFEIIYNKYGGTVEGETKLAAKLAKKYGNQVRLLVAPPHRSVQRQLQRDARSNSAAVSTGSKHEESYYEVDESQRDSKLLDFTSARFDALYALNSPEGIVMEANPTTFSGPMAQKLDNISKFRVLLPECDPQRLEPKSMHKNILSAPKKIVTNTQNAEETTKIKKIPMFLSMASRYENKNSGPLSVLYSIVANRQRARVMVRYVDCVRGTLTGYLIAFDKHFNMILKDVDEVYSGRVTRHTEAVEVASGSDNSNTKGSDQTASNTNHDMNGDESHGPSKAKLEAQRRRCYPPDGSGGPGPAVKQRYFHQLIVRGDNVVMVWRAEAERSIHPRTNKSPITRSVVHDDEVKATGDRDQTKVGTAGSLYYALQRWETQNQSKTSSRQRR